MKQIANIFKRELLSYYTSPVAYTVYTIFLLLSGYFFYALTAYYAMLSLQAGQMPYGMEELNLTDAIVRPFMHNMSVIMLLTLPMLTMRIFAEEKKLGTIELLFTYPLRDAEVVAGKMLAACTVFTAMIALTVPSVLLLFAFGSPDIGPMVSGYIGLLLMGYTFIALGMFTSSLTENQIVAAVTSFGALLLFWLIGWSASFTQGTAATVLNEFSIIDHFDNFTKGLISTSDISYYLIFTGFFVYLTLKSLETRKWRS